MTPEEKNKTLSAIMMLKEKTIEKETGETVVKGRLVGHDRKQHEYAVPGSATSPTVATESIFITTIIYAKEERDVAILDLPGAFLHADQDESIHMVMRG